MDNENKKPSTNFFKSLRGKMLMYTVIPLIIIAAVIGFVGAHNARLAMVSMVEDEMSDQCDYLERRMDALYPGDYSWEIISDDDYKLYKGEYDITTQTELLDSLKVAFDNEFTVYLGKASVLTSYTDDAGSRYVLSEAPVIVRTEVIEGGQTKFYSDVTVDGIKCFAYFRPITYDDGTTYAMYAIYHSAEDINGRVNGVVFPLYAVCFFATIVLGFISVYFSQGIVNKILAVKNFMESVSEGKFDTHMNATYMNGDDELSSLARSGVKMQDALKVYIDYDVLTRINNRRYANIYLEKMHEEAGVKSDYCIAIGDIDFFKKVNDTYGHDAGDVVLRNTAEILRKNVPPKCLVARWGGEEFLFAFKETTLEESAEILEKCREEIKKSTWDYDGQKISVTMSFGVAAAKYNRTVESVVMLADDMLYEAKEKGRDRIVS